MHTFFRVILSLAIPFWCAAAHAQESPVIGDYVAVEKDGDRVKAAYSITINDTKMFEHAGMLILSAAPSCYIALRFVGSAGETYVFEGYEADEPLKGVMRNTKTCKSDDKSLISLTFNEEEIEFYIRRSGYGEYTGEANRR